MLVAIEVPWGLDLLDAVGPGAETREGVRALRVRGGAGDPRSLGIQEVHGHAREWQIAGRRNAVAVVVGVDSAADAYGQALGEIVLDAVLAAQQDDLADDVLAGRGSADCSVHRAS